MTMENHHVLIGDTSSNGWFFIVMLVFWGVLVQAILSLHIIIFLFKVFFFADSTSKLMRSECTVLTPMKLTWKLRKRSLEKEISGGNHDVLGFLNFGGVHP